MRELPQVVCLAADHDEVPGDIPRLMRSGLLDRDKSRELMLQIYRQMPQLFKAPYASLLQHIASGNVPLLFNCAAGKDRTGVAAALVLTALGVPRELVIEDYLVTEQFFHHTCTSVLGGPLGEVFSQSDRTTWEPLIRADAGYLLAMFEHLERHYGGADQYIRTELGMSPAQRIAARNHLLE
jgi:protein-tyrosine phosphatase